MAWRGRAGAVSAAIDFRRDFENCSIDMSAGMFIDLFIDRLAAEMVRTSDSKLEYLRHSGSDKFTRRSIYA